MALSTALLSNQIPGAETIVPPAIAPTAPPAYVVPISYPMPLEPVKAPAPADQTLGSGGTAFSTGSGYVKPQIYIQPPVPADLMISGYNPLPQHPVVDYNPPPNDAYNPNAPVVTPSVAPLRPGEDSNMPAAQSATPGKSAVASALPTVPVPGPIAGKVLGLDLSTVPLWAWLAGAAVIGAKLLR